MNELGENRLLAWDEGPSPRRLGSCAECGCLVLPILFTDGRTGSLDPGFTDRRWFRALLTPEFCLLQGFAWLGNDVRGHECPPEGKCPLPRRKDRVAAMRLWNNGQREAWERRWGKGGLN